MFEELIVIDLKKITVLVGFLRRLNIDLDRGHRWDLSTNFMKNPQFQHFVWNFLNNLIDVQKQNKNSLLIQRAITDSQRRDASSLMGNHYSILKSITTIQKAQQVTEIGTYTGMSAISFLDAGASVKSFDIVSPFTFEDCILTQEDLAEDKIDLVNANLFSEEVFEKYKSEFVKSDIIFLDGPKSQNFEQTVLPRILELEFYKNTLIIVDDIHMKKMKILWETIPYPRIDISLLGHVSGTGIIFPYFSKIK